MNTALQLELLKAIIDDVTAAKKQASAEPSEEQSVYTVGCPWSLGALYLIRTVTMTLSGRLTYVGDKELVLEDAAWIADTGVFSKAIADPSGKLYREVEPFPKGRQVIVGRGSVIDAVTIESLPLAT